MARRRLNAGDVPTPGPWLVRGEAEAGASPEVVRLGIEPATNDTSGGWHYLIRQDTIPQPGGGGLHVATGIQRLADAKLMAAAPDLADAVLVLLTTPTLMRADRDGPTRQVVDAAWSLLVRVAPHLEL